MEVANCKPQVDYSHPEMLSALQLYQVLTERQIQLNMTERNLDKDKLLEIFHRTIMPLPQREYRQNRRGQLLTRKREKLKRKTDSENEKNVTAVRKIPRLADNSSGTSSRLISSMTPEKKTTKTCNGSLNRHSLPSSSSRSSDSPRGDKSNLKRDTQQRNENSSKKKHKPITWP